MDLQNHTTNPAGRQKVLEQLGMTWQEVRQAARDEYDEWMNQT